MERVLHMHKLVYVCAGGMFILSCVPHVYPSVIKNRREMYGKPPDELVRHVKKIAKAMELRNPDNIDVFMADTFSNFCLGNTSLPNGAMIGLSKVMLFRDEEDVRNANVTFDSEPVDWSSPEGQSLIRLLIPTANIINFRIAHEIAHLKNRDSLWKSLMSPLFLVGGYHAAVLLCRRMFRHSIVIGFSGVMVLTLLSFHQISAWLRQWCEYRADRTAAMYCKSYAEGGVQIFTNMLQLEQLTNRRSADLGVVHRTLNHFKDHPSYEKRLDRLERILLLYR